MRKPLHCYAEKGLKNHPAFQKISREFGLFQWIEDYKDFRADTMSREKQSVIFAKKRGPWIKPFRSYEHNPEFSYFSIDLAEGCLFDCVYCYLQSYLNHGALVLFVDFENLESEMTGHTGNNWFSTGLLTDSLLSEDLYPVLPAISAWIPPGSILEMRTKSANISSILDGSIRKEQVVISWSLNPQKISQKYEYGAASLKERLAAAKSALDSGYRIGFHLDPVFHFDGWQDSYAQLFEDISVFPRERVAFVSLGLFRYMPELGSVIRKRFPYHEILGQEFFPDADGKFHYWRGIRKEMHRAFAEWLRPWKSEVPILWSMEPDARILQQEDPPQRHEDHEETHIT